MTAKDDTQNPEIMLKLESHVPERALFPVVDAHNHLFTEEDPGTMIAMMDAAGVETFINLTGNTAFTFVQSGYTYTPRDIGWFIDRYVSAYPGRFACFTMSEFANCMEGTLIEDNGFGERAARRLEDDVHRGACGLKITKELGMRYRDLKGDTIPVNDPRLDPVWAKAAELGIPVLIHTSDPAAFFLPDNEKNEHHSTLLRAPDWSCAASPFSKEELLDQRDELLSAHRATTFICAHVANYPEDLSYVDGLLEEHPNVYIDIAARIDELGRQPYSARDFLTKRRDRVLFGTDMPARADIYRTYFRFLETRDEYFAYPDYVGVWGHQRWMIYGLGLERDTLRKIYRDNARRIIPFSAA